MAKPVATTPVTVLDHLLSGDDFTVPEICDALGKIVSVRQLRRLAKGETSNPTPAVRRALQDYFDRGIDDLLAPYRPELLVTGRSDGHDEREVVDMAAARARAFALQAAQAGIGTEGMEQIYDDVRHIARAYPTRPLAEILGDLSETQDAVFRLIEGRQRPDRLRQLYFLAAVCSGLLAKASHDVRQPHAALTQARTAYLCAENADHLGLRAWIRGLQAQISYWAGSPHESLRFARDGSAIGAANTASIWLPASEARAWAAIGNTDKTQDAIRRAEEAWSGVNPDEVDELGGICTFGRMRQLYYAADALAWLPEAATDAEQYSIQATEAYEDRTHPDWSFGDAAGSVCDLAISRLHSGELDGAVEAMRPVLDLPVSQRINGIVSSAQRVHDAVTRANLVEPGEALQQEIESFVSVPMKAIEG